MSDDREARAEGATVSEDDLRRELADRVRRIVEAFKAGPTGDRQTVEDVYEQTVEVDATNALLNFRLQVSELFHRRYKSVMGEPMKRLQTITSTAMDILADRYRSGAVFDGELARLASTNLVELCKLRAMIFDRSLEVAEVLSGEVVRTFEMLVPAAPLNADLGARGLAFASLIETIKNEAVFIEERLDEEDDATSVVECAKCQGARQKDSPSA